MRSTTSRDANYAGFTLQLEYNSTAVFAYYKALSANIRESLEVESEKPSRIKQINKYTRGQSRCRVFQHISGHFKVW
jgi:hypothetical protein